MSNSVTPYLNTSVENNRNGQGERNKSYEKKVHTVVSYVTFLRRAIKQYDV